MNGNMTQFTQLWPIYKQHLYFLKVQLHNLAHVFQSFVTNASLIKHLCNSESGTLKQLNYCVCSSAATEKIYTVVRGKFCILMKLVHILFIRSLFCLCNMLIIVLCISVTEVTARTFARKEKGKPSEARALFDFNVCLYPCCEHLTVFYTAPFVLDMVGTS